MYKCKDMEEVCMYHIPVIWKHILYVFLCARQVPTSETRVCFMQQILSRLYIQFIYIAHSANVVYWKFTYCIYLSLRGSSMNLYWLGIKPNSVLPLRSGWTSGENCTTYFSTSLAVKIKSVSIARFRPMHILFPQPKGRKGSSVRPCFVITSPSACRNLVGSNTWASLHSFSLWWTAHKLQNTVVSEKCLKYLTIMNIHTVMIC